MSIATPAAQAYTQTPPSSLLPRSNPSPLRRSNRLVEALPAADLARWQPHLETVTLSPGQVLATSGATATHVYFPVDALVSLMCLTEDGGSTEVGLVGNEGIVGVSLLMGDSSGAVQAVVQCAGLAYRMKSSILTEEFQRSASVRQLMLRYLQALLAQSAQMAVCNRHHTVEQQLCRWLLSALDRLPSNQLSLTQELIANTLGVRRAGVTEAASRLRRQGLLQCRRGHIAVLDRARLEQHACECYSVMRREHQRLAPPAARAPLQPQLITVNLPGLQPLAPQSIAPAANDFGARRAEPARQTLRLDGLSA